jgi:hypothetical protein
VHGVSWVGLAVGLLVQLDWIDKADTARLNATGLGTTPSSRPANGMCISLSSYMDITNVNRDCYVMSNGA